jgi:hypothetical protein
MLDKSPWQRVLKSTLFGVVCGGLVLAVTASTALFPGLIVAVGLPGICFFKELLFELIDARAKKNKNTKKTQNPPPTRKRMFSTELLSSDEVSEIRNTIQEDPQPGLQIFNQKLVEYDDFFRQRDPITGKTMNALEHPVTIEGVKYNMRWSLTTEKNTLKKILYEKKSQERHPIQKFLCNKSNVIVACYDGLPNKFHIFSMFARAINSNLKNETKLIPENAKQNKLVINA